MASRDELVMCHSAFFHGRTLVQRGEVWLARDPLVTANQRAFGPLIIQSSIPPVAKRQATRRIGRQSVTA